MINNKLILLSILLLVNCNYAVRSNYFYFNSSFECKAEIGRKDIVQNNFKKYIANWNIVKSGYTELNKKIKQADTVIVGDSLIYFFTPELLKREFPKIAIAGRGIGGDMTDLLLDRLEDNVISLHPSTIILEIGGNDLIAGKCLSYIEKNVAKLISKIRLSLPSARIIFITVPPTSVPSLNAIVPVYDLFLYSLMKKYKDIVVLDLWEDMRAADRPEIKQEFTIPGDKIHFNEKGYGVVGKLLRPYLQK